MSESSKSAIRWIWAIAFIGCAVALVFGFLVSRRPVAVPEGLDEQIRKHFSLGLARGGKVTYPNAIGHQANPDEAVRDFERIYRALDSFRRQHGRMPTVEEFRSRRDLAVDGMKLQDDDFRNPDWKFAEKPGPLNGLEPGSTDYACPFLGKRPDGTAFPAFPNSGELDVWMYSDLAVRSNTIVYPDKSQDVLYSGVYVVLYSDGSIREFSHKETFYVEVAGLPMKRLAFPGMAGYSKIAYDWEHSPMGTPSRMMRISYEK